jgi:putative heme-binding domain-containing protein
MTTPSSASSRRIRHGLAFLALVVAMPAMASTPADIAHGATLYQGLCVTCHGFAGAGGDAPSLNRAQLVHAPDDDALRAILANGMPERGMPRVRRFTDPEVRQLVAYVRSLGLKPQPTLPGSPANGAQVYARLGCATCHIVQGQGGSLGPDLTSIGRMRGPDHLRLAIVDPPSALPRGTLSIPGRGYSEYLPVHVVTHDGRQVQGMRINEDAFTIQLRDLTNQVHSFRKTAVARIEKQLGTSLMPPLAAGLSRRDLDDLVAYVASLQGP